MLDFESIPDRKGQGSYKWDLTDKKYLDNGAFPFSVADMEFACPEEIRNSLSVFCKKGFFCYTGPDEKYRTAIKNYMKSRHNWAIENDWIVCTGGVVCALNTAVRAFTNPGEGVIIQKPVYYPFSNAINNNSRKLVNNPLVVKDGKYCMNLDQLEELVKDKNNKLMLLCSPHNPVGRVWDKETLEKIGNLCADNGVTLVSDEIHFDLTRKEHRVITTLNDKIAQNTVVCTAISKSFNIAGLGTSNIIIQNEKLRTEFKNQLDADGYTCINCMSYPATLTAYTNESCIKWLNTVNEVIDGNFKYLKDFMNENIPDAKVYDLEGTYLAWIDFSFLNMEDNALLEFMQNECKIIPDPGFWFGDEGRGFERLNLAVPFDVLKKSLDSLKNAINNLKG